MINRKNINKASRDSFTIVGYQSSAVEANRVAGILPVKCELVKVYESHTVVAGQTCTYAVEHLTTGEAPAAGDLITTAESLEGTINTPHAATILTTNDVHKFVAGDRISILVTGTTTGLAGFNVTCQFIPID